MFYNIYRWCYAMTLFCFLLFSFNTAVRMFASSYVHVACSYLPLGRELPHLTYLFPQGWTRRLLPTPQLDSPQGVLPFLESRMPSSLGSRVSAFTMTRPFHSQCHLFTTSFPAGAHMCEDPFASAKFVQQSSLWTCRGPDPARGTGNTTEHDPFLSWRRHVKT